MAKRAQTENREEIRFCCDCALGEWDMSFHNLDVLGNPTLIICPKQQFKRLRNEKACKEHFVERSKYGNNNR